MNAIEIIFNQLVEQKHKLALQDGQLHCYASPCGIDDQLVQLITQHKTEIIQLLAQEAVSSKIAAVLPVKVSQQVQADFPLSQGEGGLYLLQQLNPELSAYNVPMCFTLNEQANIDILLDSWQKVLTRYPLLTCHIVEKDGVLYHHIPANTEFSIHQHQVEACSEKVLTQRLNQVAKAPFDLNNGPLWRMDIFHIGSQKKIVLLTIHHLIFDGSSSVILLHCWLNFYRQLVCGEQAICSANTDDNFLNSQAVSGDFNASGCGYAEFVEWEKQMLNAPEGQSHQRYWQQQLQGELSHLQLPADFPAKGPIQGETWITPLPTELFQWVSQYSQQNSLQPSVIFLGLFQWLLHVYTREKEIIVGMPVLGRVDSQFMTEIGYFINMIPLRTRCEGERKLLEYLRGIQATLLDGLYHSSYPFPLMLKNLPAKQNSSAQSDENPVFQVAYAYQNFIPSADLRQLPMQSELGIEAVDNVHQEGEFDFGLEIFEQSHGLDLHFKYNAARYQLTTVQRLFEHLCTLLHSVKSNPDVRMKELSLLSNKEQQLLTQWNTTNRRLSIAPQTTLEWIEQQVAKEPDATALVCEGKHLSYAQLWEHSLKLGCYLQQQGVCAETLVGIYTRRSTWMVIGILGIWQAGGAYVPLDADYPQARLQMMIAESQLEWVLSESALTTALENVTRIVLDEQWPMIETTRLQKLATVNQKQLAYVIFTSGSTGKPKGVMIEHASLVHYLTYCRDNYCSQDNPTENDVNQEAASIDKSVAQLTTLQQHASLVHLPLTFDASITALMAPLVSGKSILLEPAASVEVFNNLAAYPQQFDFIKLTPGHLLLLKNQPSAVVHRFLMNQKLMILGGEALTNEHLNFLAEQNVALDIVNEYGPTEATVGCSVARIRLKPGTSVSNMTIGKPIANMQMYILDEQLNELPIGVVGEIYIAGAGLARGYFNQPELTAQRFIENPNRPGERLYQSGDLGRWLENGEIEYWGRIDQQIKIRGYRIELDEINTHLLDYPTISSAAVVVQGETIHQRLVAFYVVENVSDGKDTIDEQALQKFLHSRLPDYMVPRQYQRLDNIPLTVNGKVDTRQLSQIEVAQTAKVFIAPENEIEHALAEIWAEVLEIDKSSISINDNFFERGGHSLLATVLLSKIRSRLNKNLPIKMLFEINTLKGMADIIGLDVSHKIDDQQDESVEFEEFTL
ncbi:amino acid adenylation domain-containing protein [Aliikangiella maris]|uniref:Amino acid adenylation domain-containing protein n=2 Tax=Aliikangiella maris TaxID=3162458 RepID=A0ABV2BXX3_9GAMM